MINKEMDHHVKIVFILSSILLCILISTPASAGWWRHEETRTVYGDFGTVNFSQDDNQAGEVVNSNVQVSIGGTRYRNECSGGWGTNSDLYATGIFAPGDTFTQSGHQFLKINDYISVSMKYKTVKLNQYLPFANQFVEAEDDKSGKTCASQEWLTHTGNPTYSIEFNISRPFIGRLDVDALLATVYMGDQAGSAINNADGQSLFIKGAIVVPQSCQLDAGTTITMDFGNIGAPLFSQAGAGNKPAGVNPQTHTIAVKCKNIDAQALLSMRLESDNVSGNAMVSDNKDVGFVISGSDKVPLKPNNIDSKIKFQLDDNSVATVPITAWPVSVTGNKPAEGRFTSEGYLRIDFD